VRQRWLKLTIAQATRPVVNANKISIFVLQKKKSAAHHQSAHPKQWPN
jgi:hypothetical protein